MERAMIACLTFFRDYAAAERWQREVPLGVLAERIQSTTAPEKAMLPWLKLARFGNARTPAGSLRHDRNVIAITGIEADYDGGELGLDYAVQVAEKAGLLAIVYTSPSHTVDRPRWRILAPASREFQPPERARLLGRLNGLYRGVFARESWTLSQAYYYGSVNGNPAHRVEVVDGQPIDLLDELDVIWQGPPAAASARVAIGDGSEARDTAELMRRVLTGEGFHTELCALSARLTGGGASVAVSAEVLCGLMLWHPENARDERWRDRYRSIPGIVASARQKFADGADARRAVARVTHRAAEQQLGSDAIKELVIAEAERHQFPPDAALGIAAAILHEKAEAAHV
jgi:hypothetical protein